MSKQIVNLKCEECDNDKLIVVDEAPWVAECSECGHPNDHSHV